MSETAITVLLLIIAVIHLIPINGFFGVKRLEYLYGIQFDGNEIEILMRHRAILFGILGGFFTYAAFNPALQPLAFTAAFLALAPFFYLVVSVGSYNEAIKKIVIGDIVAAVSLCGAVIIYYTRGGG